MDNKKEKIFKTTKDIDKKIDAERKRVKQIDKLYDEITKLNRQINRCVEVLSTSMEGQIVNVTLDEIYDENRINYRKASELLEEEMDSTKKKISEYHNEKEEIVENIKRKYTIDSPKTSKIPRKEEKS